MNSADSLLPGCQTASSRPPVAPDSPASPGQHAEPSPPDVVLTDDFLSRIVAATERAVAANERIAVALEALVANGSPVIQPDVIASKAPQKRHRRGAKRKDADGDRQICEAWDTGHYATWKDLGKEFDRDARDVELAVGRFRKYRQRHPGKG
jgi:hypothetical protein